MALATATKQLFAEELAEVLNQSLRGILQSYRK